VEPAQTVEVAAELEAEVAEVVAQEAAGHKHKTALALAYT
jgi:hypothetical protein